MLSYAYSYSSTWNHQLEQFILPFYLIQFALEFSYISNHFFFVELALYVLRNPFLIWMDSQHSVRSHYNFQDTNQSSIIDLLQTQDLYEPKMIDHIQTCNQVDRRISLFKHLLITQS